MRTKRSDEGVSERVGMSVEDWGRLAAFAVVGSHSAVLAWLCYREGKRVGRLEREGELELDAHRNKVQTAISTKKVFLPGALLEGRSLDLALGIPDDTRLLTLSAGDEVIIALDGHDVPGIVAGDVREHAGELVVDVAGLLGIGPERRLTVPLSIVRRSS